MPIRVELYTDEGVLSGLLARSGHLRDVLEAGGALDVEAGIWRSWSDPADTRRPPDLARLPVDSVLVAVGDDGPLLPVHAAWHAVRLDMGRLRVEGELPTMPGYDPGRSLTRPTGEFVLLRDVQVTVAPDADAATAAELRMTTIPAAHVNRYAVDRVAADLMLGFYFPGAVLDDAPAITA